MNTAELLPTDTAPLRPRPAGCAIPLTGSQRRLWNYATQIGQRTVGTVASASRVSGPLDRGRLQASLTEVARRHEALHTRIVSVDNELRQSVDKAREFILDEFDLSQVPRANLVAEARRVAEEYAEQSADPTSGPLFRAALLRMASDDHVAVFAADHMISDAHSSRIINREIWQLYSNVADESEELAPLPVQFPDYAVWQAQTYGAWLRRHANYWKSQLSGAPAARLPLDGASADVASRTAASLTIPFGKLLSTRLLTLAAQSDIRLPLAVLAIHACTMSRWCEQDDLCISFASHGRHTHPELRGMVGLLASFPPLRLRIREQDTFLDLLQQVRLEVDLMFAHFDFDRAMERNPGCVDSDVGFNWVTPEAFRKSSDAPSDTDQTRVRPFPMRLSWLGKFFVFYTDTTAGVAASVTYRPDLFAGSTVERFGKNLRRDANALIERPSTPLRQVLSENSAR